MLPNKHDLSTDFKGYYTSTDLLWHPHHTACRKTTRQRKSMATRARNSRPSGTVLSRS
uniref:Uncharacterized protein n=1 Tax=Arundo donax TaxID=35708 RepID=A0A0A9D058_ARUDO